MKLYVTVTIDGTDHKVSTEDLAMSSMWRGYIVSFSPPSYRTRTEYGGYCELAWGSIEFFPELFDASWPPPNRCQVVVQIGPDDTDTGLITMFEGYLHLSSFGAETVSYDMWSGTEDVELLTEAENYDGETTPIPQAFGLVSHVNPFRYPDDPVSGYYVYAASGLSTDKLAKIVSEVKNATVPSDPAAGIATNPTGYIRVTCTDHGFITGDTVTLEGTLCDGVYEITKVDDNTFDCDEYFDNLRYSILFSGTSDSATAALYFRVGNASYRFAWDYAYSTFWRDTGAMFGIHEFYVQNNAVEVKFEKDASWSGSMAWVFFNKGTWASVTLQSDNLIPREAPPYDIWPPTSAKSQWSLGAGWSIVDTGYGYGYLKAVAGTASTAKITITLPDTFTGGQAFEDGASMFYDDGVPIPENVEGTGSDTWTLNAEPVGTLTVSGKNSIDTLNDLIAWACDASRLNLSYDTTNARSPSPDLHVWADSQQFILDFLSDVCAANTHMFYIDGGTLYLIDMDAEINETSLDEYSYFSATYSIPAPIKSLSYTWQKRVAVEDYENGVYVKETDHEETVTNYPYGSDDEINVFHYARSDINSRLDDILAYKEKKQIEIRMPITGAPPKPGDMLTGTDTAGYDDISFEMKVRGIQYDFNNEEYIVSGDCVLT